MDRLRAQKDGDQVKQIFIQLKNEKFFVILAITFAIILFGALGVFFADQHHSEKGFDGVFDVFWWAVVTISTVGYGDIVPQTVAGKIAALIVILSGPALLSLITASVASILVEKKIKEGKGLEAVKDKDHVIICGWNENGEKVIDGVLAQAKGGTQHQVIVLVNELDRDDVQSIQYKYKDHTLRFVRGNFVKEDVLARANVMKARAAIVLADKSGNRTIDKADERTIFGTMAIKAMTGKVRTCAELINADNREHLMRANVDEIVVRGETSGSMLAKAATAPGMTEAIRLIANDQDENRLWRIRVPLRHEGKTVAEVAAALRERYRALLIGVLKERQGMTLDDILSDDSTIIDQFIKRKFEESGKEFFGGRKDTTVMLNPPDDYPLTSQDLLLVISKEKPS